MSRRSCRYYRPGGWTAVSRDTWSRAHCPTRGTARRRRWITLLGRRQRRETHYLGGFHVAVFQYEIHPNCFADARTMIRNVFCAPPYIDLGALPVCPHRHASPPMVDDGAFESTNTIGICWNRCKTHYHEGSKHCRNNGCDTIFPRHLGPPHSGA